MRRAVLLLVVLALAGCGSSGPGFGKDPSDLLPDLATAPVAHMVVSQVGSLKLLRLSHEIVNVGRGPFEIHPVTRSCGDQTYGKSYGAQMWIFKDANHDGIYERNIDTQHQTKDIACLIYHKLHRHWHLDDFVRYDLYGFRPNGALTPTPVRTSGKVSFCVVDNRQVDLKLPGAPPHQHFYDADQLPGDCQEHDTLGLSVGYGDIYDVTLADQWIEIDGVPDGRYCLVTRTDYENFVPEGNETDNDRRTVIDLQGQSVAPVPSQRC